MRAKQQPKTVRKRKQGELILGSSLKNASGSSPQKQVAEGDVTARKELIQRAEFGGGTAAPGQSPEEAARTMPPGAARPAYPPPRGADTRTAGGTAPRSPRAGRPPQGHRHRCAAARGRNRRRRQRAGPGTRGSPGQPHKRAHRRTAAGRGGGARQLPRPRRRQRDGTATACAALTYPGDALGSPRARPDRPSLALPRPRLRLSDINHSRPSARPGLSEAGIAVTWSAASRLAVRRCLRASVAARAGAEVRCGAAHGRAMGPGRLSQSLLLRCRRAAAALGAARSARPLSAAVRLRAPQRPPVRGDPPRAGGQGRWKGVTGAGGDQEEDEEEEQDEEEDEELEELLGPSPLAVEPGAQRVAVVHPAVRGGSKKSPLSTGAWRRRGWAGGR